MSHGRTFDSDTGEVRSDARTTRLEPQPAALLALLLDRAGVLVTHAEIRAHLWQDGRHVDYAASVHYAVGQVRRALDVEAPRGDIETIPRRGYRLRAGAVTVESRGEAAGPTHGADAGAVLVAPLRAAAGRSSGRRLWMVVAALGAVAAVAVSERQPNDHHEIAVRLARAVHAVLFEP